MPKLPPIREGEDVIQIDQKKDRWPFMQAMRLDEGELNISIDSNEGGQVIGLGSGVATLTLSKKKAKRLREFLERTENA